jgi:hypothetical protein
LQNLKLKHLYIMKNLRKLSILTITVLCANYFSTLAQDEQKAFKEGDRVISVGIGAGSGPTYFGYGNYGLRANSNIVPSLSFDYGLKGTRGIVSIGGFMSYSQTKYENIEGSINGGYFIANILKDSIYSIPNGFGYANRTLTAGLRFGLHYSTRKWDLYAGVLVGYRTSFTESRSGKTDYYKGLGANGFPSIDAKFIKSETSTIPSSSYSQLILSPYAGARYYVTPKVSLNLEVGQYTGNIGIGYKF